jgi:hypothetical protein
MIYRESDLLCSSSLREEARRRDTSYGWAS